MPGTYSPTGTVSPNWIHRPWWEQTPDQVPPGGGDSDVPGGADFPTDSSGQPGTNTIRLSGSILDNVIPMVYGSKRVVGRVAFWNYTGGSSR